MQLHIWYCQPSKTIRGSETAKSLGEDEDIWKQLTADETVNASSKTNIKASSINLCESSYWL